MRIRAYKIRYGVVDAESLSDRVIVKNPNYGYQVVKGWGSRPVQPTVPDYRRLEQESGFYTNLEKSILEEGVRNPIFCNAYKEGTFCRYGTSRLWIAQKHNLKLPMVVADYAGTWDDLEELKSKAGILKKYKDKPEIVEIGKEEMRIDQCPPLAQMQTT